MAINLRRSGGRRILPFRIPFFRIFYSTTYTTVYIITLCVLAITPVSLIWVAIENLALQYTIMIGGTYLLTGLLAIFIYSSRLYTNRTVFAAIGKAYIPVEPGEIGKAVRKMIVKQFERSAMIAWESRPRDLIGEILKAEQSGHLPPETMSLDRNDYTVGKEIPMDPSHPPWGNVQHAGWSSPANHIETNDDVPAHVQFATVVAELPNLIEARAVSLAPPDPTATPTADGEPSIADPDVVELLQRPQTMGLREYLTQLSFLGLVNPPEAGQAFLQQYEKARFGGVPITEMQFRDLMAAFAQVLEGMTELDPAVIDEIRAQMAAMNKDNDSLDFAEMDTTNAVLQISSSPPRTPSAESSSRVSPVTARTRLSRNATPYLEQQDFDGDASVESLSSVVHNLPDDEPSTSTAIQTGTRSHSSSLLDSESLASIPSDTGSVVIHASSSSPRDEG